MVSYNPLSTQDADALLATARTLRDAAAAGAMPALLRGRTIALLAGAGGVDTGLFVDAAGEIGAKVVRLSETAVDSDDPQQLGRVARVLGRLYDAVECEGLPAQRVQQLASLAGVPVYDGLAGIDHPVAQLSAQLGTDARRYVMQAALLTSISQATRGA